MPNRLASRDIAAPLRAFGGDPFQAGDLARAPGFDTVANVGSRAQSPRMRLHAELDHLVPAPSDLWSAIEAEGLNRPLSRPTSKPSTIEDL